MSELHTLRGPVKKDRPAPVVRNVERRDVTGAVLGTVELDAELFGIEPNEAVLHQVITAQLAARRSGTQSTKTRAEVRGGGTKPFRQKGTGRSRQGSTRSPQWVGGGVALGPKPRKYDQKTPKKMIRLALRSALSDRAINGQLALIDTFGFEAPKTKDAVAALDALGLDGSVLVVLTRDDEHVWKSFANLTRVHTIVAEELNAYDIIRADWVLFTDATLPSLPGGPWGPAPKDRLPWKSVLIASQTDPWASIESSRALAGDWGSEFVDAGESGRIDDQSGHGPWPDGLLKLAGFLKGL